MREGIIEDNCIDVAPREAGWGWRHRVMMSIDAAPCYGALGTLYQLLQHGAQGANTRVNPRVDENITLAGKWFNLLQTSCSNDE